ncbi:S1/P1 nuclease [Rhodohalobacter sulfatireducens]|uniref:S1/P1 nuclease n=1 Tax=Rhodohalobacter sulfatireducens TaxID=2911366 RepID=A0ABS9KEN4_9BACT|nr:S1/P1 nuclease [Rhodohalobacter sulfatireducens]MCG2589317.1 S1/P1 nuclease [Rhodohalobacter sulfatireducens]
MHFLISFLLLTGLFIDSDQTERWGQIGHYVSGEIAEKHLNDLAKARVNNILGDRSIAVSTVWMDDIRSDDSYDFDTWHYVTIPDGEEYDPDIQEESGDIIWALETLIEELKTGNLTKEEESEKLKLVIHMIGDIHQPLHVGNGEDRGGNDVRLQWFGDDSNIHRVWDSGMIESFQLSYTELAKELDTATHDQIEDWQDDSVRDWAYESMEYRDEVYDLPDDMRLSYEYRYYNKEIIYKRLLQAGIRMAGVLNEIYGEVSP